MSTKARLGLIEYTDSLAGLTPDEYKETLLRESYDLLIVLRNVGNRVDSIDTDDFNFFLRSLERIILQGLQRHVSNENINRNRSI